MPLPPDVDEIIVPKMDVLLQAVKDTDPDDVELPTWKMKPRLGIYSPTPQYAPLHYIEPKPLWMKARFVKRKYKKFYRKLREAQFEKFVHKIGYLPDPRDRLSKAGVELMQGRGSFKAEEDLWSALREMSADEIFKAMASKDQNAMRLALAAKGVGLNWRPGYQQVAIRDMINHIKRVDVVVEVRDARIPWASAHPDIPGWIHPKPRVIVLTRADLVPPQALEETIRAIEESEVDRGIPVVAVDAQRGCDAIEDLRLEMVKAGAYVNRRRLRKGINPRAIRAIFLGFPNVGKSSLVNRLTGRKVAVRTGWAGVTKKMTWHNIGGFRNTELDLLDSPGLIPFGFGKRYTEEQASLLCMCRLFTDKVIDREQTAYDLVHHVFKLAKERPHMVEKIVWRETKRIYNIDFQAAVRQEAPFLPRHVPVRNPAPWCGKILNDFNHGYWGKVQLEVPPAERRQDWSYGKSGKEAELQVPATNVRGVLGPPREVVRLATTRGKDLPAVRDKVPVHAFTVAQKEGLFDGW